MTGQQNAPAVKKYYNRTESRLGYWYLLGGTKHFGLYRPGDNAWRFDAAMRRMEDKLLEKLNLTAGQTVLDAGCGMGRVALHIAQSTGAKVWGVDILDFNLEEARRIANAAGAEANVEYKLSDYSDTGFADATFDAVYTMETLVHAADPGAALQEFYRVLKPGGKLVCFEYARSSDEHMTARASKILKEMNRLAAMPAFDEFIYGRFEELALEQGFGDIELEDLTLGMLPMLWAFNKIAILPYTVVSLSRKRHKGVNTMSAVEMWRYRKYWRYYAYSLRKPVI